jgi:NAD(P)-dependent dehydrogenase (short-subunit alcohol dehydrogenase family)
MTTAGSYPELQGKTILIAGGAKNLGALIGVEAAKSGANVVIHHHSASTAQDAADTAQKIQAAGGKATVFAGDLTQVSNIVALFDHAEQTFGRIDIAVNTVGRVLRKPILETTEEEYDSMFAINSKCAYFFIQEAGKRLKDGGKIINIGTSLLAAFTDGYSTYAGGKAPLEHFTRAAAKEFASRSISVNTVAPGPMDTPFFYGQESPERVMYHKSQAMGNQLTNIEDIAPIVLFLATSGRWITGQIIFANGGYTTR